MANEQDTTDPLEAELRSFRPVRLPGAVLDSVADELAGGAPARRHWHWFAAAAAAAACVFAAAGVWRVTRRDDGGATARVVAVATLPAPAGPDPDDSRPSLAAYRRALARAEGAVDELLDRHAARLLPGGRDDVTASTRVGASTGLEILR